MECQDIIVVWNYSWVRNFILQLKLNHSTSHLCPSFHYSPWIHFHHIPRKLGQIVLYHPRYHHLITRNIDNRLYYCVNHYHFIITSSFQLCLLFSASRSASTGLNWLSLLNRVDIVNQILSNFNFYDETYFSAIVWI